MNFAALVSSLDLPHGPRDLRACPDQYVGRVAEIERVDGIIARQPALVRPNQQALILVLESPHIYEFLGDPGPAKGATGRRIAKYLRQVRGLEGTEDHLLLLVNAVQHQCSLGRATEEYRDTVFVAAWTGGGKKNFIDRLKALYRDGDTVVCGCTKGNSANPGEHLRQLVYEAILCVVPESSILRRTHPASWHNRRHRHYQWTPAPVGKAK
jgi:hypothetical protein